MNCKRSYFGCILGAIFALSGPVAIAANDAGKAPRGGMCGSINVFDARTPKEGKAFDCDIIGRVKNVNEIYEKGFRVVSSGFVPESDKKTPYTYFYLVIEERK